MCWTLLDRIASSASKPSVGWGATDIISELPASRINRLPVPSSNVIPCGSFVPKACTANRVAPAETVGKPLSSDLILAISLFPRLSTNRLSVLLSKAVFKGSISTSGISLLPALSSPIVIRTTFPASSRIRNVFAAKEKARPFGSLIPNSLVLTVRTTQIGAVLLCATAHDRTGIIATITSPVKSSRRISTPLIFPNWDIILSSSNI